MATKYLKDQPSSPQPKSRHEVMRENWEVMRPFVHFAFKTMLIVGGAVVSIIRLVPELLEHKDDHKKKDDRIVKI